MSTSSSPPRKKSLSPPQAPSKSISSKSPHYTSSSSPSKSPTPTHVTPPPKLHFVISIKLEPQELPPLQVSPNDPYIMACATRTLFSININGELHGHFRRKCGLRQGEIKRGKVKVSWEDVCLPKVEGGLGVHRLEMFNAALMSTHIWKLITHKEYMSPGYDVLSFVSSWFLVKCMHIYAISSLMDKAYWMSEHNYGVLGED
uniref:Reverse transcriptase domain, reverse transcriptase zinc-binding domain protein n=1 Tax=Tanacetum cinerariifolium TaxID=118510 RepID=A0A6L2LFM8_TANCI|nr:reverse transcriptase domain, reverse transcriptase zinc-binding domain protein [Tanacetum cinerariifolium]